MCQNHDYCIAFIIVIFWSYLIPQGTIGIQVEHVSLSSAADGSEKTNKDLGNSVMLIRWRHLETSGMAAVGSNCSAVFRGEAQAEGVHCRPRGRLPLFNVRG